MPRLTIRRQLQLVTMTAVCALAGAAFAQDMPPAASTASPQPQVTSPAPPPDQQAAAESGPAKPAQNPLNKGQLEQLVAPIALYPDPLLSQVLMASTYPLEVVEAERWVRDPAHQSLKGDALTAALKDVNWDPSVKALVPFPKLLSLMADKLEWTEQLGNAFLAQQADVMNAVQGLRHDAQQAGNLKATPQCHCVIQTSGDIISIMPSDNQVVGVPVYNARLAYGAWPHPDYPPYFFPVPPDFAFDPGYVVGYYPPIELAFFGPFWGWGSIDWGGHSIVVNRTQFGAAAGGRIAFSGSTWSHDPTHRGGVAYSDPAVTSRFGAARTAAITASTRGGGTAAARGGVTVSARGGAAFTARGGVAATTTHADATFAHGGFAATHGGAFHGPVGRGPAPVRGFAGGGGHVAHANFAPAHMGGGAAHGGGGHGGGGAPHGGGGGHHH